MNRFYFVEILVKGKCGVGVKVSSQAKCTVVYGAPQTCKQQIYIVCSHKTLET